MTPPYISAYFQTLLFILGIYFPKRVLKASSTCKRKGTRRLSLTRFKLDQSNFDARTHARTHAYFSFALSHRNYVCGNILYSYKPVKDDKESNAFRVSYASSVSKLSNSTWKEWPRLMTQTHLALNG